jgi:uncharacterized protein (TIGR02118 family)
MKLVAIFKKPEDPQAFEKAYLETHMPLIQRLPGLISSDISRFTRTLMGEELYLMNVMTFEDLDRLKAAMKSPEMAAASENLNTFAAGLVTLYFAE